MAITRMQASLTVHTAAIIFVTPGSKTPKAESAVQHDAVSAASFKLAPSANSLIKCIAHLMKRITHLI